MKYTFHFNCRQDNEVSFSKLILNPSQPSGDHMYHPVYQLVTVHSVFMDLV
jgi:hypothetical protein